ncbi:unnamed protein product [Polarella glacialis]|uniref:Uncharacterized protein n=1 Tax=Polarella glacialis TaxID=89957 RepID=A0A813JFE3_POLGL|nr:unnamed protein product [Polarella glacialis]CAE8675298.1 unnamed protein product [Polarella glacialis]
MPIPDTTRALEDTTVNEPSTIATTGHTEKGDSKKPTAAATAAATTAATGEPRSGAGPFSLSNGESERKEHCVDPERPMGGVLRDSSTMLRKLRLEEAQGGGYGGGYSSCYRRAEKWKHACWQRQWRA